jgi:hypothetical protein
MLEKCLNFVVSPSSIPVDNLICCIEDSIKTLADEDKEPIRQDCKVILIKSKPPRRNISREEHQALRNLYNNTNLVILRVDKVGTTIIMNQEDYNMKMNEHLSQSGSYRKISNNLIKKITREVKKAINNSSLSKRTKKRLLPNNEIILTIYGLPKIHKERIPLRPIVNTIGSPTYELCQVRRKNLRPCWHKDRPKVQLSRVHQQSPNYRPFWQHLRSR